MEKINVGIIGFGLAGKVFHSQLLAAHPDYKILKILSSRVDEIKDFDESIQAVSTIDELLTDDIDLVINAGSNDIHYSYTKKALENNKHVVVEKPFVNTIAEGQELIELAKKKNLVLSVFHNRRFDSDFLTVKKLIESKALGDIKHIEIHFDRFNPGFKGNWREKAGPGSGILMDLGSHLIDQVLCLWGFPKEVIKDIAFQKDNKPVDDYFHLILKYGEKRAIVHGTSFSDITPRYQVIGEKGSFVKFGMDPQEKVLKQLQGIDSNTYGVEEKESWGELTLYENGEKRTQIIPSERGNYLEFYSNISKSIQEGRESLYVQPEQALEVISIIVD